MDLPQTTHQQARCLHQRLAHQQEPEVFRHHPDKSSLEALNDDCLMRIFHYLHMDDKIRLRRTCRRWRLLLDQQLACIKALRLGQFPSGGYHETSGLLMPCRQHQQVRQNHQQLYTGTLFNSRLMAFPAELDTQCFSVARYDYLHRALRHSYLSVTMLSLGRLNISYRLLMVLTHNLPELEHLELIGCASAPITNQQAQETQLTKRLQPNKHHLLEPPSLEAFNNRHTQDAFVCTRTPYNQHQDEQVNLEQRLVRAELVRNCQLVKEARDHNLWPKLTHLLVKDCNLLNEFSLSLLLAVVNRTLDRLMVDSNQYLTGEFLNFCGPKLEILRLKHCPLVQLKFLEELRKIKQFLAPTIQTGLDGTKKHAQETTNNSNHHLDRPQPIDSFSFRNHQLQDIYCTL